MMATPTPRIGRTIITAAIAFSWIASGAPSGGAAAGPRCEGEVATIVGTSGDDRLAGTANADVIVALRGDDTIIGRGGNDRICAGGGDDTIHAGKGNDVLNPGWGDDRVFGGRGDDQTISLKGPNPDWSFAASGGNDLLVGGAGNDTLDDVGVGGKENTAKGGAGDDRIGFSADVGGPGFSLVRGGSGNDEVWLETDATVYLGPGHDRAVSNTDGGHSLTVRGGPGQDDLSFDHFGTGYGGRGADFLQGFYVADWPDPNALYGGPGDDHLRAGGSGRQDGRGDTLRGGSGEDLIEASFYTGADELFGGGGDDTLDGVDGAGDDTLNGGDQETADACESDPGDVETNCEA